MRVLQPINGTIATPAAAGYAYLFDSTRWQSSVEGTLAASASLATPGAQRGQMTARRLVGSVQPIGQDVTMLFYMLSPVGAWTHQSDRDVVCPAGQITNVDLAPADFGAADCLVALLAGLVAPSSIAGVGYVTSAAAKTAKSVISYAGASHTLSAADAEAVGIYSYPGNAVVTLPTDATVPGIAIGQGGQLVAVGGATTVSLAAADGVTVIEEIQSYRDLIPGGGGYWRKLSANTYKLGGGEFVDGSGLRDLDAASTDAITASVAVGAALAETDDASADAMGASVAVTAGLAEADAVDGDAVAASVAVTSVLAESDDADTDTLAAAA